MAASVAVVVEGLTKAYGGVTVVDGIDLHLDHGEVVALLGPNGAGKTTTVEILEGNRRRDEGRVEVLGFDPAHGTRAFRERIGIVLQEAGFEEAFTVGELVRLHAGYYPSPRPVREVIEVVGLTDRTDVRVRSLSGGQRRRLDLALGIVGDPELLFLDEPTTGFDPAARRRAWDLVARLRELGTTILLTTHYLDEAEHLADRVVVVNHGRVVASGTPAELAAGSGNNAVLTFRLPGGVPEDGLPPLTGTVRFPGTETEVVTPDPTRDVHTLTGWAIERGIRLERLSLARPCLEDVYFDLVGRHDEDGGTDRA
ncbi:MAG: type transport system ATP-binding protein [Actinomycetota bacterium]|nr:type transport system ATP-binding protein [Actinomycetota bacterium]